jgi:phosphorylcholine metabolism protein LicD
MDAATKMLTIKGAKGEKAFDVTNVKMEKEPMAGDKVMVKYTEKDGKMTAKSVKAVKAAKKAEKKETKPAEKPAAPDKAPAKTPAPAPAK